MAAQVVPSLLLLLLCLTHPASLSVLDDLRTATRVWVTLDPDTVSPKLLLSEDGRRVTRTDTEYHRPDNPKRFTVYASVLGQRGFSVGRHYWELQLLQEKGWVVGVIQESVKRKEKFIESPEMGHWYVYRASGGRYWAVTYPRSPLFPSQPPLRLGVYLDYEGGRLSVYNADTMEEIYTFTGATFTGTVYPYFNLWEGSELRLV